MGIFQMKSHSSCTHLPARRAQRPPEAGEGMERWRCVWGRREKETAVGIEKELGSV